MNVWELTLTVLTSPQVNDRYPLDEKQEGCHDVFVSGLGHRLLVNFGLLDRCLRMM
jgi:hypothetical protein